MLICVFLPCLMPKQLKQHEKKTPTKTVGNVFVLTFPSVGSPFNSVLIMCFMLLEPN